MSIEYTNYFGDDEPETIETVEEIAEIEPVVDESPTMMGVIYNAQKVYMREAPDRESAHVDVLDKGEEVMIDGTSDDPFGTGWYHLITASGKEGYTMSEFVKVTE